MMNRKGNGWMTALYAYLLIALILVIYNIYALMGADASTGTWVGSMLSAIFWPVAIIVMLWRWVMV